jgi:DNA (cytosine-5)-methyltransferase 1
MDKPFANLNDTAVNELLPTPTTQDGSNNGGPSQFQRNTLPLNAEVTLLPTPNASDCTGGGAHPDNREGHSRQLIDYALLAGSTAWGKYEPAIRRWESLTRPAPAPTEPNKNGNPRLAAAFSEWLMGWPDGWVTDPAIGISRNDQLRIVGNGVCPQQAAAALRFLLEVAG